MAEEAERSEVWSPAKIRSVCFVLTSAVCRSGGSTFAFSVCSDKNNLLTKQSSEWLTECVMTPLWHDAPVSLHLRARRRGLNKMRK